MILATIKGVKLVKRKKAERKARERQQQPPHSDTFSKTGQESRSATFEGPDTNVGSNFVNSGATGLPVPAAHPSHFAGKAA